jgi:hypothetical protein
MGEKDYDAFRFVTLYKISPQVKCGKAKCQHFETRFSLLNTELRAVHQKGIVATYSHGHSLDSYSGALSDDTIISFSTIFRGTFSEFVLLIQTRSTTHS